MLPAIQLALKAIAALCRRPGYLIASVVILAAGMAAETTVGALLDATFLRTPSGSRTGGIYMIGSSLPGGQLSYPDYQDLTRRCRNVTELFAYNFGTAGFASGDDLSAVGYSLVSGNYFPALGIQPAEGRGIGATDDFEGSAAVAVISTKLSRQFALHPGAAIKLDGFPFRVIGVMGRDFEPLDKTETTDVWIPIRKVGMLAQSRRIVDRNEQWISVGGHLLPGSTPASAAAEVTVIGKQLQREYPATNVGMELILQPILRFRLGQDNTAKPLLILFAFGWFLFALSFANFFALTLVRLLNRRRQIAIRISLGARLWHLSLWILGEIIVVVAIALLCGSGLARLGLLALKGSSHYSDLFGRIEIRMVGWPLAGLIIATFASLIVVWALIARRLRSLDVQTALRESHLAPRRQRALVGLFAFQLGLIFFMAAMAASFGQAISSAATRSFSFRTRNVLFMDLQLRPAGLGKTYADTHSFLQAVATRVRAVPGVQDASYSTVLPLGYAGWDELILNGRDPGEEPDHNLVLWGFVAPRYFETIGLPLLRGRTLQESDLASGTPVAMVDEAAVRRFWPNRNPIGESFLPWPGARKFVIVGVVANLPALDEPKLLPRVYFPTTSTDGTTFKLVVSVAQDSREVRRNIEAAVGLSWPFRTVPPLWPVSEQVERSVDQLVSTAGIVLWAAGAATLVTLFGFYVFSAYVVSLTLKDSVIRVAVGASLSQVVHAHLARFRWGVAGGLAMGAALIVLSRELWGYFALPTNGVSTAAVVGALLAISMAAAVGLSLPLHRVLWRTDFTMLRNDTE